MATEQVGLLQRVFHNHSNVSTGHSFTTLWNINHTNSRVSTEETPERVRTDLKPLLRAESTLCPKKRPTLLTFISSPNINRFSKLFDWSFFCWNFGICMTYIPHYCGQLAIKWLLNIPPHFCVATLPC